MLDYSTLHESVGAPAQQGALWSFTCSLTEKFRKRSFCCEAKEKMMGEMQDEFDTLDDWFIESLKM